MTEEETTDDTVLEETIAVFFKWESVEPDANQWKPMKPLLAPQHTLVRVDVPAEMVLDHQVVDNNGDAVTVLSPEGMVYAAMQLANATSAFSRPQAVSESAWEGEDDVSWDDEEDGGWGEEESEESSLDEWAEGEGIEDEEDW